MQKIQLRISLQLWLFILKEPQPQARSPPVRTDTTKAFRELRVRPALSDNAGGPPSPKKRKASNILDKEFILQDEKVTKAPPLQAREGQASDAAGIACVRWRVRRVLCRCSPLWPHHYRRSSVQPPSRAISLLRGACWVHCCSNSARCALRNTMQAVNIA